MGLEKEKIQCAIEFPYVGKTYLFNRALTNKLTKEALGVLKKYEIPCEELIPGAKGGGLDTILNILKTAWQNKDIIYAIFNIAYLLKRNYLNWIDDYLKKNKPRVVIILVVNYSTTGDYWCIGDEINGLKFLADEIYRELSKKYPIFIFDQSLFVTFEDLEKRADCYITSEKNNKFNRYRLFKIFDSFSGKRNMQYHFSITNFFAVKRTENELNRSGSSWIGSNSKYYYLFFSSRILSDYLKKKEAVKDSVEIKG